MPTQHGGYKLKLDSGREIEIPSVTKILKNLGWSTDQLMSWAARVGADHTNVRDDAAHVGTCAHALIDHYLTGTLFDEYTFPLDVRLKAQKPLTAFKKWHRANPMQIIASEFPLVSSAHRYAGTPDFLVKMGGDHVLIDIKTSSAIYPTHILQVVAYMDLVYECMNIYVDRGLIVRVGKDGSCQTLAIEGETITQGRRAFYHLLELHKLRAPIEALVKPPKDKPVSAPSGITFMGVEVGA